MFGIFDKIEEFFKELLLGGIQANLESMFIDINDKVGTQRYLTLLRVSMIVSLFQLQV